MTTVYAAASMSLDGYVSGPAEAGFDQLFDWYGNGDVEVTTADPALTMRLREPSAQVFRQLLQETGALVVGRKTFDLTDGWGGRHPIGCPVVVLTHQVPEGWPRPDAPFTFVTDGIEPAVATARQLAGDRLVGVSGGSIARQCLDAELLDEIRIDLVPVLLGGGTPFFDHLRTAPVVLDGPSPVIEGDRVTHLRYRVRR
ncbi:dihydrofolate reductase family protein [Natronosporangium hydrolyticum]|uniref:Dihydrofolate reductase family protein n=1 Tax=Natronosporangium hydrolyticum TaxID=2811111 RepID=A0A895YP14_9ACTN|nr:dihydrofolate reductase family protein [Natronosporangium hydrolyticum]QSB16456.1 dihydrofolate reductase family protein [Natronosporangium hydrolyticum]